jgi:2-polyprenyl-3-methyl-5-hydroxy-6-metoxy-1,4-benzoquinol methylase
VNLNHRSYQKELLDRNDIPFEDIARNMKELNFINTYLGGHSITIGGLKKILSAETSRPGELLICEIGCGGGDNLQVISQWCRREKINARIVGIDINPDCTAYAESISKVPTAEWISSDYKLVRFKEKPDIIFNSLFCHHFDDEQMIDILQWMHQNSKRGFFINDLHRHSLAFNSIKLMTRLFSKSYLVKNDAPLSVRRGFRRNELEAFCKKAGITDFTIQWKWAFRWLITSIKKN